MCRIESNDLLKVFTFNVSYGIAKGEELLRCRREKLMQERNANRKDGNETREDEEAEGKEEDGEAISVELRRCGFR